MSGALASMAEEIEYQIEDLPVYSRYLSLNAPPNLETAVTDCIFVGAGDSLAAAKAGEYLSGFKARALDP